MAVSSGEDKAATASVSACLPRAIPFEPRIGVTGHRNLIDPEAIRRAVDRLLDHIQRVLESAAAHPHGAEAGGQTWSKRFDRALLAALRTVWREIPPSPAVVEPSMRTPLRWCVVSALAQGADAIVAEAVLSRQHSRLQAILPFAAEEYGKDFEDAAHRETFHRLLARDPAARVVGVVDDNHATRTRLYREAGEEVVHGCDILIAVWDGKPAKGEGGTGDIVQHAFQHGRLTLWIDANKPDAPVRRLIPKTEDGRDMPGGWFSNTRRTMLGSIRRLFARNGSGYLKTPPLTPPVDGGRTGAVPVRDSLRVDGGRTGSLPVPESLTVDGGRTCPLPVADSPSVADSLPVHGEGQGGGLHPQRSIDGMEDSPARRDSPIEWTTGELPGTAKELSVGFHQLSAYNRDMAVGPSEIAEKFTSQQNSMTKAAREAGLPSTMPGDGAWQTLAHYCRSDLLAQRYQALHLRSAKGLFILAASGVTVSVLQVMFLPAWYGLVALEVAAMLAVLVVLRISRKECWHEKWLHDRHFAERLRGKLYLDLLGETSGPCDVRAASTLAFYRRPADWVDIAFGNLNLRPTPPPTDENEWKALRDFINTHWLSAQAIWQTNNAARKGRLPKQVHWIGAGLFAATLFAALLHALGVGHGTHGEPDHGLPTVTALLVSITVLLPVWGATLHAIDTLLDWRRIASRSERMGSMLHDVAEDLRRAQTPEEIRAQVRAAYEIMATENQEWAASLAFRGPTLPA